MEKSPQELDDGAQNDREHTSEFSHLYKNTGKGPDLSQQERREILLKQQKDKRHSVVDEHRDFSDLFLEDDPETSEASSEPLEGMEIDAQQQRHRNSHRFALMHSEWLTEVPTDLEENWLVKLAPDGFRVLVIAKKYHTILCNKRGRVLTLKTHLPGGGLGMNNGLTVLDCIYNKVTKTIFVLDCLFWNTMSMLDSETSFRFYWLKNQFFENSYLLNTNKAHKFQLLEFLPAELSLIQKQLFESLTVSNETVLYNGVVFYHKELHYAFKQTPLLGWLNCYMLPEKLKLEVPQELMNKMPHDYECLEKYLEKKNEAKKQKKYLYDRRRKMDTS